MQLVKSHHTIEQLSAFDEFFKDDRVNCWSADSGKIKIYLFSSIYDTADELAQHYKELRDHVAISFQSRTLEKAAERWNLYLLYLVKEEIPQEVKQNILQDKFSARKMVWFTGDKQIDDNYIKSTAVKSLIDIDIPQRTAQAESLEDIITAKHPQVAAAVQRIDVMNNRNNLESLLKILNDD